MSWSDDRRDAAVDFDFDEGDALEPMFEEEEPLERIGVVKGPAEQAGRYLFITSDNRVSKIGEFVHYYPQAETTQPAIFGKIVQRKLSRSYPSTWLSDPQVGLREMAFVLGTDAEGDELYEVEVQVMGAWIEEMTCFVNPRIAPDPGDPVYLTSSVSLTGVLSPQGKGQMGSAHLGSLLTRGEDEVPIVLSVRDLVSTHLAILAGTGSGKSYTASVLLEELLRPYNRAAVLIADPHGEYSTLEEMCDHAAFFEKGYQPQVLLKPPHKIKVRLSSLRESDMRYLMPEMTEKQRHFLSEAYRKVTNAAESRGGLWGLHDLKMALDSFAEDQGENQSTVNALRWKLDMRFGRENGVFSDAEHIPLQELFAPGQCTVLQLSELDAEDQQIILGTILRRAFYSRVNAVKGMSQPRSEALDFPVFILVEEAHRFAPAGGHAITTSILKTILSEGRKFGMGIGVISQRPGKLDADVLSQCMTQLFMRIVNPLDQRSIAESVESAGRDLLDELPALTRGQVIVSGSAIRTPVLCRVRKRFTTHGGQTLHAPAEWAKFFSSQRQEERKVESALPADTKITHQRRKGRIV